MNISEVKDLMREFDSSTLREFNWSNSIDSLSFSKNQAQLQPVNTVVSAVKPAEVVSGAAVEAENHMAGTEAEPEKASEIEGECVKSPLVGVAYMKPAPDKEDFVQVGDTVKKGQTLLIIEAMKVMNEIPAPKDGLITEVLVSSEEVIEYGQELVRIK